ncbi:hypothetical protein LX32DRAFT_595813 [Colletotrichum zoysiae]|uniref:Uncharacterized protein n=1 Tax=Colletotrichum zoysiae TaxID=1216348 RepID=A0AAD9HBQ3_9PEZI|nr:hypothetical protein LX32DRAFT_595813 [Colletotrichum zoysiae]
MCNILQPVAECQQCSKAVEFEPLPQPCSQIANTLELEIGRCGTLTSQTVSDPRGRVCEDCRVSPAQPKTERTNRSNGEVKSYPLADYLESFLPPPEPTARNDAAQQGSLATTSPEAERHVRESRAKYTFPSETACEDAEGVRVPVDTPAALSGSKAQPPLLETVLDAGAPGVHASTLRSATALRIETPWNESAPERACDPWWYPEIWGPAKDLPRELARLLRRIPPADTFHGHRIYVFHDGDGGEGKAGQQQQQQQQATVLLATPGGTRARVVSGALYDEGARLVTRRHLARARYEELSREEREKMAEGEQCCIFHPCRVASCPLLHADGQHRPARPAGETLLGAMERGYAWRKNWGARTGIPRPTTSPVSSRRRYAGSRTPPRQREEEEEEEEEEEGPSPGASGPPAARQTSTGAGDAGFPGAPSGLSSTACSPARSGRTDRFAYRGRAGRIRPAHHYHHHPGARRNGSPAPIGERRRPRASSVSGTRA